MIYYLMTYIQDNATLKALIQRSHAEIVQNKYSATRAPYADVLIEHWDMLDDTDKKEVCQICLDMTMNLKGAESKNNELSGVKRILMMSEYPKLKEELKKHIDVMPVKNGNQVVQRYIQAMLWDIELDNYYFDKINDKTSFALRGNKQYLKNLLKSIHIA